MVKKCHPEGHLSFLGGVFANVVPLIWHYFSSSVKILNDVSFKIVINCKCPNSKPGARFSKNLMTN